MKIRVTSDNYCREVLDAELLVLVEFFAVWCSKCAMMEDVVNQIAKTYDGQLKVCQIEIDESQELAAQFDVQIVPTFVVFKDGNPVAAASGLVNREVLLDMIEL